jgi:hypothetical protein
MMEGLHPAHAASRDNRGVAAPDMIWVAGQFAPLNRGLGLLGFSWWSFGPGIRRAAYCLRQ